MSGDDLLKVFEKVNVNIGNVNPNVIKAWFDTDCKDLLKWMCRSITEECYISPQQEAEYGQLYHVLEDDQLNKKVDSIEAEFPDIFQPEMNLFNIEIANDSLEILEENLKDYDHQLEVNQKLNQSLSAEFSKISDEEIQSEIDQEFAQHDCMELSEKLDKLNCQTYEQIIKYNVCLNNYESTENPEFANNKDIAEFEEKFSDIVNNLKSATNFEIDLSEKSAEKYENTLFELENRIFHSRINHIALQMEVEGLSSTSRFLNGYDVNTLLSFVDDDPLQLSVAVRRDQQISMLNVIEEASLELAQQYVNQPLLRCSEIELNFYEERFNYLNKFGESLIKVLLQFIIMYNLYFQEKMDITSTSQFFRNIKKYINTQLEDSSLRTDAMLKLISEFKNFCLKRVESKFKFLGDFSMIVLKDENMPITDIVKKTVVLRKETEKLRKQHFCFTNDTDASKKLLANVEILEKFLMCGPTIEIITIPHILQMLLFKVNESLLGQNSSVKSLIHSAQKPKDKLLEEKSLRYRRQLWMYFITDGEKLLSFLEQLKTEKVF